MIKHTGTHNNEMCCTKGSCLCTGDVCEEDGCVLSCHCMFTKTISPSVMSLSAPDATFRVDRRFRLEHLPLLNRFEQLKTSTLVLQPFLVS